ncbi:mitochondrial 54S ribosomal protein uL1m TDEL_0F03950 [Torulaspora delbrueckii]|uniref:Large ribosomal subunit protein uL1m n=1 Tax=Torulaspora delbrueckii TaxID=4950 RepID=G8ZX62_TORDE|nr:mitochondrial 54S ribosomal protein MRPL1 [Torulaspora delbrueckii]CCE93206.1 hypothetical protein TDEL_0F03950 [Torulaspora delbrueckii]
MLNFSCIGRSVLRRSFLHTGNVLRAEEAAANVSKLSKDQLKKREIRRLAQRKAAAKKSPSDHPLYMSIPMALRFLRAAEVGQPQTQQTITLTTAVVAERGVPALAGSVSFPKPLKEVKIAVFSGDEDQLKVAREKFNCHLVGGTEIIEKIKSGEIPVDFDKAFATPDIAPALTSQLARILGPRGVLPTVKKGTVATDVSRLVQDSMGSMPFRQRGNAISIAVGKSSFSDRQILENAIATHDAVKEALANQVSKKTSLLGKTTLSSTHGPGIVIDFA